MEPHELVELRRKAMLESPYPAAIIEFDLLSSGVQTPSRRIEMPCTHIGGIPTGSLEMEGQG